MKRGQHLELTGNVTHIIDGGLVAVDLGVPVTVNMDALRLVMSHVPPTQKAPMVDKST